MSRHTAVARAWAFICVSCLAGAVTGRTDAAEFRSGQTVQVEVDESIEDDLYAAGEEVVIAGIVYGDVVTGARVVRITGVVEGDLIAAAQSVVIEGKVGDDARIAGQVLTIAEGGQVVGDVIATGQSLETKSQSNVEGQIVFAGAQALLAGGVGEKVQVAAGKCRLSGKFADKVELEIGRRDEQPDPFAEQIESAFAWDVVVPKVPAGLTIDDSTEIDGALKYQAPQQAKIDPGADIAGEVTWEKTPARRTASPSTLEVVSGHLRYYVGLLIVGVLMLLITPAWSRRLTHNVGHRPVGSFLSGMLCAVLVAVVLVVVAGATIALSILLGAMKLVDLIPFVLVLGGTFFITFFGSVLLYSLYLGNVVVAIAVGRVVLGLVFRNQTEARFLPLVFGLALLVALMAIPYAGGVIALLIWLVALGGLFLWWFSPAPASTAGDA